MTEDFKRKLTAILSADVEGYSRLMGEDEDSTVRTLTTYRNLMSSLIERYHGQVVDSPGDNLLAEFESVRDAVLCAVEIQEEIKVRNTDLPDNRKMQFRIGINLGDIIKEEGRIYGDGVNVAARIESLADAGGICLSSSAYDQVKKKLNYEYEHLGEYEVKNIDEPVSVYKVIMVSKPADKIVEEKKVDVETSLIRNVAIILVIIIAGLLVWRYYPSQPKEQVLKTIAVLPFDDYSPEGDQEHFVLGLSEEILNSLTQIPELIVTAKTSSFYFKDKDKTFQEIANKLDVEHILEGSVRKAGNTLRITAQLIKADDESHLWSETYDKELKDVADILRVQEDIAKAVAKELKLTLGVGESLKKLGGTDNLEAYELYLIASGQRSRSMLNEALESINPAISLDPNFALAWAEKGLIHMLLAMYSPPDRVPLELDKTLKASLRANELEPGLVEPYMVLGSYYSVRLDFIEAERNYQKGVELSTEATDIPGLAIHNLVVGHLRKNKESIEMALRENPLESVFHFLHILVLGYLGDMERAEEEYKRWKPILGDQWRIGGFAISVLWLKKKDVLSLNELLDALELSQTSRFGKEFLESAQEGQDKLRLLYNNNDDLTSRELAEISILAAYLGDSEFALNTLEKSAGLHNNALIHIWAPIMKEVRQLPRFKEFVREIGLVDYWKEYGWPDLCHPIGDDDFECE